MTAMSQTFDPAEADPRAFRDALGRFATGVTVITCASPSGPLGMTANSFTSLSLDPPLVLWSPAKASSRYPFFVAAPHFAIHVLGAGQEGLCTGFARAGDAFGESGWTPGDGGTPLIDGCLSRFECSLEHVYDGGDHSIVVGRVSRVVTREGAPLLFHSGKFGALAEVDSA